ncbi:lasso peptide biosynthesis B2 protein [Shimazuella kribbensis]|uniref:lasso peptide biosynthesis B2 protein n=1 Tax=Shimazuella kribbensis TaxID=139808 RepID=UPI00042A07D8|nr:lasso peptide biosynthesis B2 protein [Shimazuella kribbensis]
MMRAWISIVLATFLIKNRSMEQLSPLLKKRKMSCPQEWSYDDTKVAWTQINKAKKLFLSRTACLEQSLALFLYATSKSKKVDLCVGVRVAPFVSHAWIEVNGVPVQEDLSIKSYKKILVV